MITALFLALATILILVLFLALVRYITMPGLPRVPASWRSQLRAPLPGLVAGREPFQIDVLPNGRAYHFALTVRRRTFREFLSLDGQLGAVGDSGQLIKTQVIVFQVSLTPASVATIVAAEQALTVTGVLSSDILLTAHNSLAPATAVGGADARVASANTINKIYINPTAGALVPTPGTYNVAVLRG